MPNLGESGSWVLDERNYGVHGHLVASDALGDAYVVPFNKILRDIEHACLAFSVRLPSRIDISRRHPGSYLIPRASISASSHFPDSGYASTGGNPTNYASLAPEDPGPNDTVPNDPALNDPAPKDPVPNDPVPKNPSRLKRLLKSIVAGSRKLRRK